MVVEVVKTETFSYGHVVYLRTQYSDNTYRWDYYPLGRYTIEINTKLQNSIEEAYKLNNE